MHLVLWTGIVLCLGRIAGGFANTIASSGSALTRQLRPGFFRLLVVLIGGEAVQLGLQFG